MFSFRWMLDCSFSSCLGASARVGFILVFPFAYSSPTASDVGDALFMNHAGMVLTSVPKFLGGCFMGYPRRARFCFIFVLLRRCRTAPRASASPSAALEFVLRQIYYNQKKTTQKSEK